MILVTLFSNFGTDHDMFASGFSLRAWAPAVGHEMDLGSSVRWRGWCLRLDVVPMAMLPEEKADSRQALRCYVNFVQARLGVVAGISNLSWILLIWFTCGARRLKPWLSVFFHMLRKPTLRFLQHDRRQVAELEHLLQDDLTVKADSVLSDTRKGWKLLECGILVRPVVWRDVFALKTWLGLGDWECGSVKPCAFLQLIEARVPVHLVELEQKGIGAAADAFADAHEAGLGGWRLFAGSHLEVGQIRWFSFKVH